MAWPEIRFRVLVIGDIIIDHDILVKRSALVNTLHTNLEQETPYEVERRYTTAGGAAGSARLLAMVNAGETYLAGFSAPTMWGRALTEIMDDCRVYDNSPSAVKLLCVWTAEGRGAVVSRLVELDKNGDPVARPSRWDDSDRFTLPSYKRQALPDWINRTHRDLPLDGILLADLNRGTIDRHMVTAIARLAAKEDLPLVVIPKWVSGIYQDIGALALIPNLKEWCQLVKRDDEDKEKLEKYFRQGLGRPDRLEEMARRSIRKFPGFEYHIVTCDSDGLVLIGPVKEGLSTSVSRLPAIKIDRSIKKGAGDVFSAQFLLAYLYHSKIHEKQQAEAVQNACRRGTSAAAAHLSADWHRMPTVQEVERFARRVGGVKKVAEATWPIEIVWDRLGKHINLDKMVTSLPGIYSSDDDYVKMIARLRNHLNAHRGTPRPRGLLIAAPSGDGKSALLDAIAEVGPAQKYDGFTKEVGPQQLVADISSLTSKVVIIDEAYRASSYIKDNIGVVQEAIDSGVLFVFAGTGFTEELASDSDFEELYNRCDLEFPKPLVRRPCDVAVILAASIVASLDKAGINVSEVPVEQATFDHALRQTILANKKGWSGKHLVQYASEIVSDYISERVSKVGRSQEIPPLSHPRHRDRTSPVIGIVPQSSQ